MRKLLMIASAAALAVSMPAFGQGKGNGGGKGGGGGGPKAEHGHKTDKHAGGGGGGGQGRGGGGGWKAERGHKMERHGGGFAGREMKQERKFERRENKPDKGWAKAERKQDKNWAKAEAKAEKKWAKQEQRVRDRAPLFREAERRDRFEDRRERFEEQRSFDGDRRFAEDRRFDDSFGGACPPGLAKKGNGCLPPGQAKKMFRVGEAIPAAYYGSYNLPEEYRDWYSDTPQYSYRYDEGNIFRIDNQSNLVSALIPLLGGGFGVGSVLPAGFDAYNLPVQYRDDFQDNQDAYYRYGDNAIYQVDPHSQMIESVVALLAGDLNVGQLLPSGYDTYNLPMEYRDQYQDNEDAWYRYADGNIYEVDPQSRMIEAIVAQLV